MTTVIKRLFNAGELSPKVYARTDLAKWEAGCKNLLNMIPLPQGGAIRRPGFEYIARAANNNEVVRLIPFQFSTTQAYIIEAGNGYMRFYKDGGQIQSGNNDTPLLMHCDGANASNSFTDNGSTEHTIEANNTKVYTGDKKFGTGSAQFNNNGYLEIADHADFFFNNNNFTIDFWINPSYKSTGKMPLFCQKTDNENFAELYLDAGGSRHNANFRFWSGNTQVVSLSNTEAIYYNNWYHIALVRGFGGNSSNWALAVNGVFGGVQTANNAIPDFSGNVFIGKSDIGTNYFYLGLVDEYQIVKSALWEGNFTPPSNPYPNDIWGSGVYGLNTSYNEADIEGLQWTQSYDTLYLTHKNHAPAKLTRTAHNNWNLSTISFSNNSQPSEWSNNNGWPRTCAFYQDRLVFASTTSLPSRLWFSKTSDYEDLTAGANDSDGMVLNLLSGTSDVIYSLASGKRLIALTDSGVQSISAASGSNSALTPTNKINLKESYFGASEVFPVKLGDIIIYAGNPASKVREVSYEWEADGYRSAELTVLADHLLTGYTVKEFAYQQSPYEIVWCRRSDGSLIALTYMQEQQVLAWSRHTSGNVQSIACIPGQTETELWAAVHRNINNNTVTFIERMRPFAEVSLNNSFFVDAGLIYAGGAVSTITGLDHLNGNSVQYLADGTPGNATIANNNLGLNNAASTVIVGVQYISDLETLPVAPELQSGPSFFRQKRITEMAVLARNSAGGTYGPNNNYQTPLFANNTLTGNATVNLSVRHGYGNTQTVLIRQSDPLPLQIDAIGMEVDL